MATLAAGDSATIPSVLALIVKLFLAPAFIVGASLVARRFGPLIGGLVGGLPVVAGPILLAFALDQGSGFAANAAVGTTLGLVSLTTFVVVYAWAAGSAPWPVCLVGGWLCFLAVTWVLSLIEVSAVAALALACGSFLVALRILPPAPAPAPGATPVSPPAWDLPARGASAVVLVLALTAAAAALGPGVSGLLAPFPIIAGILASFTHAHGGVGPTRRILRGLVLGFFAFALFCFTVAETVETLGIAGGFLLGALVAMATQGLVLWRVVRPAAVARATA